MFLRRDFYIKKQLEQNKFSQKNPQIDPEAINKLKIKALEQLSMSRIKSRQMQFHKIQLFLLIAPKTQMQTFYQQLRLGLQDIFNDEKTKKAVEEKWSHSLKSNVMGLFNKIATDFYSDNPKIKQIFSKLYTDTIIRLMKEDKLSRIQQKFLDSFVIETIRLNQGLEVLKESNYAEIFAATQKIRISMLQRQVPKSLSNCQFLQYAIMSLLKMELPHEKYLYSHLIHAPNPKYLLPFRKKGVFGSLTNQILLKLSKVDMVGFRYWSYYDYQQSDVFSKIRKASGWEAKSQIMRMILKSKMNSGLEKYMNLINEKIKSYNTRQIDDAGINDIMSYVEICLEICDKKDRQEKNFGTALQRVDLGQVFQQKNFESEHRLKQCMLKLVQLYLKLLVFCSKQKLKLKFIQKISVIICKLIKGYNEQKFKTDITNIVLKVSKQLTEQQKMQLLFYAVDYVNRQWEKQQQKSHNLIIKINPYIVSFIAELAYQFGFEDYGRPDCRILKLQFFYILAINYKENEYFQSKKKLSMIPVDINHSLSNNQVFNMLQIRKVFNENLRQHLRTVFENYQLDRPEHEGLLAIIDEIVSFRIQVVKENAYRYEFQSFFALLVNFLQQSERVDPTGKLLSTVRNYFNRCIKTYMHDTSRLKFQDSGKKICIQLLNKNVSYVAEGTVSANPIISQFCEKTLYDYIQLYPQIAFHTQILTVMAQCISFLYKKSAQEYESKAERLKGKFLVSNILIPTKSKQITLYMIKLMTALYQIILNGHCLNQNYLKIRVLYLIKENTRTANITFGWKYLKHVITNFKEDKQFITKQVLLNNSCAWFINEQFFSRKVRQMKAERILLDKYLLPIHYKNCSPTDLKKIFSTVEPQLEVQFLIMPPEETESQIDVIIEQLEEICERIEDMHDNFENAINPELIQQEENKLYEIVSRVKMIYISKHSSMYMLSKILEVCRKYNNHQLLKYVFLKVVPLLYCTTDNILRSLNVAAETLYYVVLQLNNVGNLYIEKAQKSTNGHEQNTFDIKTDYFDESLRQYERNQDTPTHYKLLKELTDSDDKVKRFMIIRLHHRRMYSLQKMYREILKFISQNFHVFVAKGIPLMQFSQILKINFEIDPNILQFLSLESICYCLTIHLQLVNLLKASVEKGQVLYDQFFIDDFYIKSLKIGLFHFQKRKTFYKQELIAKHNNIKSLKTKINFFIQICDYLRNDDFHRFRKKKLPKRQQLVKDSKTDDNLLYNILNYAKPKQFDRGEMNSINEEPNQLMNSRQSYINEYQFDVTVLRYCLLYLISEQVDKIKAYSYMELEDIQNPYSLAGKKRFISHQQIMKLYEYFGDNCSVLIYNFVKVFGKRIDNPQTLMTKIKQNLRKKPDYGFPQFLSLYIDHNKDQKQYIKKINFWKPPNVQILFKYLSQQYERYPYLQLYVTKVLSRLHSEQILFYLPQIYQTLTLNTGQIVYDFLLEYAKKSASFAHQLIWISKVESKQQRDPHNNNPRLPGVDENLEKLCRISNRLIKDTIRQFTRQQKSFFKQVDSFYEEVTAVSGKLNPKWPFAQKKQKIKQQLAKIIVPKSVYLPTNPFFQVVSLKIQSGTPMQSAAKCPFLLTFRCKKYVGPDEDFEKRKEIKNQSRFIDSQQQFEPIKQQQLPIRLPIAKSTVMGSRVGKIGVGSMGLSKSQLSDSSESNVLDYSKNGKANLNSINNLNLDVSEIRMTFDQPINVTPNNNGSKRIKRSGIFRQRQTNRQRERDRQKMGASQLLNAEVEVSCIFKVFDDIRQDSLALQVIQLFMQIFDKNNLDLKLFPYKTISNRTGPTLDIGGIIEVVPKTVSRDSIGKTNEQSLYQFFLSNFGPQYNTIFQQARQCFIKSQAAYSIISYILQIKDRHNGNILINRQEGYLVHIDFGFIFDISPANNLRFERADFKLTEEMIKIMGGKIDSQPFRLYMNLVIKGFLIARKYHEHVVNIVKLMFHSGLPCFLQKSIVNLQSRFVMHLSEIEAAEYMKAIILKAADHWTTNWYDKIQWIQQRIYH